jgi:hypothetical protein
MKKTTLLVLAVAGFVAAVLCSYGKADATTCLAPTINPGPAISLGTSINVYATQTVLGPFTVSGNCTSAGGPTQTYTFTITYGAGNNLTGSNRATKCTSGCGINGDTFAYLLCADAACSTPIGNGGTQSASCSRPNGNQPCGTDWSVTFYAEVIQPVAGSTNDSSAGNGYTDTFSITVTSP